MTSVIAHSVATSTSTTASHLSATLDGPALTGFGLLIVAAVGARIAWQQARTARTKLQLDLYALRYPVYAATRQFLSVLTAKATPSTDDLEAFRAGTSQAQFLFDVGITVYLKQFLEVGQRQLDTSSPRRAEWVSPEQLREDMAWVTKQYDALPIMFSPYLQLSDRFTQSNGS